VNDPIFVSPTFYEEARRHGFDMTRFATKEPGFIPATAESCLDVCLNANDFLRPEFNLAPLKKRSLRPRQDRSGVGVKTYSDAGKEKSAEQHYDCMNLNDIFSLKIEDLAHPDGHVGLALRHRADVRPGTRLLRQVERPVRQPRASG